MTKFFIQIITLATAIILATPSHSANPKARKAAPKPNVEELLNQGESALASYDFDALEAIADRYEAAQGSDAETARRFRNSALLGQQMLERVEEITLVDSVLLPKDKALEAIRLSRSAGQLRLQPDGRINHISEDGLTTFASTAKGDSAMITRSRLLADGSAEPARVYPNSDGISRAVDPFLMPDGLTLYFAAEGEQSLGGLDIFITRRQDVDGDFLQPQNLGMPYNSPANDYMLAIDEANNVGYWISDRAGVPDMVTVYTFRPRQLRTNYDPADENIIGLATLRKAPLTKERITLTDATAVPETDFEISLPDGKVITTFAQLSNNRSRDLARDLVDLQTRLQKEASYLLQLREEYAKGNHKVADRILKLEAAQADAPAEVQKLVNEIVRSEQSTR